MVAMHVHGQLNDLIVEGADHLHDVAMVHEYLARNVFGHIIALCFELFLVVEDILCQFLNKRLNCSGSMNVERNFNDLLKHLVHNH
mgnify:CR=1 FL=1